MQVREGIFTFHVTTQPLPSDRQIRRLTRRNRVDTVVLGLDLTIQAEQAE